jgi:DNA-binding response OmpR family regulator
VPKILIVDDEVKLAESLGSVLKDQGWTAELAHTGPDALQLLKNFQFDIILLDCGLPEMTGVEICQKYRLGGGESPIIFVTGRNAIEDKEAGFEAGGDDYITKPFDVRELLARIKAIRQRPGKRVQSQLSARGVVLDPQLRTVKKADNSGETVQLSALESSILEYLLRNKNCLFSSTQLFEAVWEPNADSTEETVRVRMRIIRQKLTKIGSEDLVETVRGSGYLIRDD